MPGAARWVGHGSPAARRSRLTTRRSLGAPAAERGGVQARTWVQARRAAVRDQPTVTCAGGGL